MLSFQLGAATSSTASRKAAEYYLDDTVQSETMRAAKYYAGGEEQAGSFWDSTVMKGRLEMGEHRAQLRAGLSQEFYDRLGLAGQPLTQERVANLLSLKTADGAPIEGRKKHSAGKDGKRPPVGFADLTFSAPKSLSVAWALAPTKDERDRLLDVHRAAVREAMKYVAEEIGWARRGAGGGRAEPGELAWLSFQHYTSRPVGEAAADPNLHTHCIVLNHVLTDAGHIGAIDLARMNGRVKEFGAVYQAHLAAEARELGIRVSFDERRGAAKLTDIPENISDVFSKRSQQARQEAMRLARGMGLDWDTLSEERRVGLDQLGAETSRQSKAGERNDFASWSRQADEAGYLYESVLGREQRREESESESESESSPIGELEEQLLRAITTATTVAKEMPASFLEVELSVIAAGRQAGGPMSPFAQDLLRVVTDAINAGIGQDVAPEDDPVEVLTRETAAAIRRHTERSPEHRQRLTKERERLDATYETSLPRLEAEFRRRAVLDENELRRVAAQALITTGIKKAGPDIDATLVAMRRDGVRHEGEPVKLVSQATPTLRGVERVRVTTDLHIAQERELISLARSAADDRSSALAPRAVERAVSTFLQRHRAIDPAGEHWRAQREMIDHLGTGGRLAVVIGVPGSGKSAAVAPLVDAWRQDGRSIYGISLAWRQAGELKAAGIEERAAIDAFLKRVESGRYELNRNSVVVVDEVGLVGSRQMLTLLRLQQRTGAQLVMLGDPRQNQPIDGAPGLELLRSALGEDAIPRLLRSVRQDSQRERDIAALFRRGAAAEALAMKREDGTAELVAGGRQATVERVAQLWRERVAAHQEDRQAVVTISAPTNADVLAIGLAIRAMRRRAGELGEEEQVIRAMDRTGETYDLALSVGDRVRLFDRVYDPNLRRVLGNNGEVVEILRLKEDGIAVRTATGLEGEIRWSKIRANDEAPVRLVYGYALTVDAAQGSNATEHIHALPSGSRETHGFKNYVAATRHRQTNWLVIDEASERAEMVERTMLGHRPEITEEALWKNVAANLQRQPTKAAALTVVERQRQHQRAA